MKEKIQKFLGWNEISKKQRIGLLIAILYWVLISFLCVLIHKNIVVTITQSKISIGGEIFIVPLFLAITYGIYCLFIVKGLKNFMYK